MSRSSPPSLTSSATLHRSDTRANGSASSKHIPLAHRTDSVGRFQPCASFGFFQIGHLPFTKITFFDTCQNRCQQLVTFPEKSRTEIIQLLTDPFRISKKDIMYIDILLRTELIKVSRPPVERFFPFQLLNRFSILSSTFVPSLLDNLL